jgi:hypothetical protein
MSSTSHSHTASRYKIGLGVIKVGVAGLISQLLCEEKQAGGEVFGGQGCER